MALIKIPLERYMATKKDVREIVTPKNNTFGI